MAGSDFHPTDGDFSSLIDKLNQKSLNDFQKEQRSSQLEHDSHSQKAPLSFASVKPLHQDAADGASYEKPSYEKAKQLDSAVFGRGFNEAKASVEAQKQAQQEKNAEKRKSAQKSVREELSGAVPETEVPPLPRTAARSAAQKSMAAKAAPRSLGSSAPSIPPVVKQPSYTPYSPKPRNTQKKKKGRVPAFLIFLFFASLILNAAVLTANDGEFKPFSMFLIGVSVIFLVAILTSNIKPKQK